VDNRESVCRILHGDDTATLCTNLVSLCSVIVEIMTLECVILL